MTEKKRRTRLVVVGNGMAGSACIEEILKTGPGRFEITVFGSERHPNYNRVLLSSVLTGEKTLDDIMLHGRPWYEENGVTLRSGIKVTGINRGRRSIVCEDGAETPYDKLILATGSLALFPKIPGADKDRVVSFRDMDDCERIRRLAGKGGRGVVIGGGLLGLEAAWGLLRLGMEVTVVHLAGRLMERQLDDVSGVFLKDDIERLGIKVFLNRETVEFTGTDRVEAVRFKDGEALPADLVVVSIGIRPNMELARSSGIYCNRGIVVSDAMQTYDPAVFALGECVEHRGATFGLVSPIFEQAEVLANHLAGDCRLVFKQKPASSRLKVPGIDLYSAGKVEEEGAESIEYMDRSAKVYKKVILNGNRVEGIIMYGDSTSGPSLFSSMLSGEDISGKRHSLLSGGAVSSTGSSKEALPDSAIVCGCNGVTRGTIKEAIEKKGLFTREGVRRETKASGSCGGCATLVDRILEETLGSDFQTKSPQGICGCTMYTRDDIIKNIREKNLRSVSEVMETLGWETVGCDSCRPAINYYLLMATGGKSEDDLTSRLVNERVHANIQKDGTFSVVPRMYGGATTPAELKKIAEAAVKYDVPLVKLTGGQRIALVGVKREDLRSIWDELGMPSGYAYGKALRTVKTCVGERFCRYGTQDSLSLGIGLEKRFSGLWMPAKVKLSVSGCPRNCSEAAIKDIGVVGVSGGWEIYAGGCGGIETKAAVKLATVKSAEEASEIIGALIQYYREDAVYSERTYWWVNRKGLADIKRAVVDAIDNRRSLLERIEEAIRQTIDPWKKRPREDAPGFV